MRLFGKRSVGEIPAHLTKRDLEGAVKKIWESGCFDYDYYQMQSARYFKSTPDAIRHFLLHGASQGLNPNRFFDTSWYLDRFPDVRLRNTNPLLDYLSHAPGYDRNPSPAFDNDWYISNYLGKKSATASPLGHYIAVGQHRGYIVSPFTTDPVAAALRPARFADLFQELVPQDGGVDFTAGFRVEPVPVERRTPVPRKTGDGDVSGEIFPPQPYIAEFDRVGIIGGTRLVIADNATVLSDEIDAFRREDRSVTRPDDFHVARDGTLTLKLHRRYPSKIPGGLHLMHEYAANYFHFIVEVLPRLLLAETMAIPKELPLLVQKGLHPNLHVLLRLVGLDPRPIVELEHRHLYIADRLRVVSDPSSIQDVYERPRRPGDTVLPPHLLRALIDRVVMRMNASNPTVRRRRIYLRRGGRYRALVNEHAIEAMLVKRDFELVSTDVLSFETQFWLMRQAAVVVAPTGAALANILWCQAGVPVCVLGAAHEAMPMEIWERLGAIVECHVTILFGERSHRRDDIHSMHDDYGIDLHALEAEIDRMVGPPPP